MAGFALGVPAGPGLAAELVTARGEEFVPNRTRELISYSNGKRAECIHRARATNSKPVNPSCDFRLSLSSVGEAKAISVTHSARFVPTVKTHF